MRPRGQGNGFELQAASIAGQPEKVPGIWRHQRRPRFESGQIEGQAAGQYFYPTLGASTLAADARDYSRRLVRLMKFAGAWPTGMGYISKFRAEFRLPKGALDRFGRRSGACREKQRQASFGLSRIPICAPGYLICPQNLPIARFLAPLGAARRVPAQQTTPDWIRSVKKCPISCLRSAPRQVRGTEQSVRAQ